MQLKKNKRNSYIELERFLACLGILLYHAGIMKTGWIFVEFFFLLTGYFAMRHFSAKREAGDFSGKGHTWYPLSYTFGKFKTVFPYTTISILLVWLIELVRWRLTGMGLIKWFLYLPTNLLLLSGFGVQAYGFEIQDGITAPRMLNPHLWYVCCMLTVLILVAFFLMYMKKSRVLVCFLLPLLCYGALILADGTLDGWHDSFLGFFACDLRALGGILLGCFGWHAAEWLGRKKLGSGIRILLAAAEILSFVFVFALSWVSDTPSDMLKILLLFVSVTISMSGQTWTSGCDLGLFRFLGKLSLPVYCIQYAVIIALDGHFVSHYSLIVFAVSILGGLVCLLAVEGGKKLIRSVSAR